MEEREERREWHSGGWSNKAVAEREAEERRREAAAELGSVLHEEERQLKDEVVKLAGEGYRMREITEILKLKPDELYGWRRADLGFKKVHDEAIAASVASAKGELASRLEKCVEVVGGILDGEGMYVKGASELRIGTALRVLAGLKVLNPNEAQVAVTVNDNHVEDNRRQMQNVLGDKDARRLLESLARRLEGESGGDGCKVIEGGMEAGAPSELDLGEVGGGGGRGGQEDTDRDSTKAREVGDVQPLDSGVVFKHVAGEEDHTGEL